MEGTSTFCILIIVSFCAFIFNSDSQIDDYKDRIEEYAGNNALSYCADRGIRNLLQTQRLGQAVITSDHRDDKTKRACLYGQNCEVQAPERSRQLPKVIARP